MSGAAEAEHQEHVGRPDADAFDLSQVLHYFGVAHCGKILEDHVALLCVLCELPDIESFWAERASFRIRSRDAVSGWPQG